MPTRSEQNDLDVDLLQSGIEELKNYVITAAGEGVAAHEVEQGLWQRVLQMGYPRYGFVFRIARHGRRRR